MNLDQGGFSRENMCVFISAASVQHHANSGPVGCFLTKPLRKPFFSSTRSRCLTDERTVKLVFTRKVYRTDVLSQQAMLCFTSKSSPKYCHDNRADSSLA